MATKAFTHFEFEDALAAVRGGSFAASLSGEVTPRELQIIYGRGYRGVRPETMTTERRLAHNALMAAMPRLYDVFPWCKGLGKGKASLNYLAALHFDPAFGGDEAQTVGSCTVHSTSNAAAADYTNDALFGEAKYLGRIVKENVYKSRGYNSHGWSCEEPASYIGPEGKGGLLYRKVYTSPSGDSVDLTKLNEVWASSGRSGVPTWLEEESRKNKAQWIIPITSIEEYRDAQAMGFAISVCSGMGFDHDETDEYGLLDPRGSWAHAMAHMAYVDTPWAHSKYGDGIGMIQQSWGRWMKQNGKPEGVPIVPVGGFWVRAKSILSMLNGFGKDSFAICNVQGWNREIDWEVFNAGALLSHLQNSTTQDYYKARAERVAEYVTQKMDELFLAV